MVAQALVGRLTEVRGQLGLRRQYLALLVEQWLWPEPRRPGLVAGPRGWRKEIGQPEEMGCRASQSAGPGECKKVDAGVHGTGSGIGPLVECSGS